MDFGWLQSDEINDNQARYSSCDMLCSHTKFGNPKILHSNKPNEKSNVRDYDTDSESEDLEDSLDSESYLSDISEEYSDYLRRDSEIDHFTNSTDNIADYADLIKEVTKICAEINRSSLKREFFR